MVTSGNGFTTKVVAGDVDAPPQLFVTIQRYKYPFKVVVTPARESVAVVAFEYPKPLVIFE